MKKFLSLSLAITFVALPLFALFLTPTHTTLAKLDIPTGLESIPKDAKSAPPCDRTDIFVSGICVERRFSGVLRSNARMRRLDRAQVNVQTRRTMREVERKFRTHPTGVRASRSGGFELLAPNSRQYDPGESLSTFNRRALRARQRKMGPAFSRVCTTPLCRATTRTRYNHHWDPTNGRVRRGYRL